MSVASSSDIVAQLADEEVDVGAAFVTRPPTAVQMTVRREAKVGALTRRDQPLAETPDLTLATRFAHPAATGKVGPSIRDAIDP